MLVTCLVQLVQYQVQNSYTKQQCVNKRICISRTLPKVMLNDFNLVFCDSSEQFCSYRIQLIFQISAVHFPYAHNTVRTLTNADISMLQCYAIIHQMKTDISDCQMLDWCKCRIGMNQHYYGIGSSKATVVGPPTCPMISPLSACQYVQVNAISSKRLIGFF